MPTFGTWIWSAAIVVIGVAVLEAYDERMAWAFAILVLLSVFLRYPAAAGEIQKLIGLSRQGSTNQER